MVSYIQSNYRGFGSGIVVPGTGIALHNRGVLLQPRSRPSKYVAPRKRPFNTIIPGFATARRRAADGLRRDGRLDAGAGPRADGASACRQGQNPQAAIDAPRWRVEGGDLMVEVGLERGLSRCARRSRPQAC